MNNNILLMLTIIIPLLGSVLILLFRKLPNIREFITIITAIILFIVNIILVKNVVTLSSSASITLVSFFTRLHAAGLTDTLGAWAILVGLMIQCDSFLTLIKILLVLIFIFFTSPTGTHALARAGLASNLKPWGKKEDL